MKMTKRILAGVLAAVSAFSFAACGNDKDESSYTVTLDPNQELAASAAAEALADTELANKNLKWLSHYDINPEEGQVMPADLYLFQSKYGGSVSWVQTTWDNRYIDLAAQVMGGSSPDFFPADDMDTFPKGAIKGMFQPIDSYIDLDSDLWAPTKNTADMFAFKGDHYVAVIEVSPNIICIYNKNTIEENGFDDPAELYAEGKWDWDTFKQMCLEFTNPDEDKYALDGWGVENAIMTSCGVPAIGLENGVVVNNLMDPSIEKVQNFMYELQKNTALYPRHLINNWSIRGVDGIGTGLTLFYPSGLWEISNTLENTAGFGDISSGEVMFVPMPRDPDSDTYYISSRVNGYCLVKGAANPEGYAAFMNCKMVASSNEAVQQISLDQLTNDYGWTDEMVEMRDHIYDLAAQNPVFEFAAGVSDEIASKIDQCSRGTMIPGEQTWTELRTEYNEAIQFLVDEANAAS